MIAGVATASLLPKHSNASQLSSAASPEGPPGIIGLNGKRVLPWRNWSGNQSCQPTLRNTPRSEEQLVQMIKESSQTIRCVGSGHSFSPLVPTDETIISLSRFRGMKHVDANKKQVTFGAGTLLSQVGEPLWDEGFGLINMPDINTQSIAGALATSTHGTGHKLGSLSSDMASIKMITADGSVVTCSANNNADLFYAAGNNLGALGVISEAAFQVRDRFNLEENQWIISDKEAFASAEKLRDSSRHFEMFAFPHAEYILMQTCNETTKPVSTEKPEPADDALLELKKWTERLPWIKSFLLNSALKIVSAQKDHQIDRSYKVFGKTRAILFNEMEYSVPEKVGLECLQEILDTIKKKNLEVIFPIEFRYVKADDVWLSPFYKRDSCSISCHNFADRDYKNYFAVIEPILLKYGGRPHWGKIHTLNKNDFAKMYEKWEDFRSLRYEVDPRGLFLNKHTKELFLS